MPIAVGRGRGLRVADYKLRVSWPSTAQGGVGCDMMVGLRIAERRALETTPNPETAWVESEGGRPEQQDGTWNALVRMDAPKLQG